MTLRVGVDLCRVDPAALRPADHAVLDTLAAAVASGADDIQLVLFGSRALAGARPELFGAVESHTAPFPPGRPAARLAAEATWLRAAAGRAGLDLWHHAGGGPPAAPDVPTVVAMDDPALLERPRRVGRAVAAARRRAVAEAQVVVVPSAFARDRLIEALQLPEGRVQIVPWPLPPHPDASPIDTVRARHGIRGRIVLVPGPTTADQEHLVAVRAMRHLAARHGETTLVLLGPEGAAEKAIAAEVRRLGLEDRVVRLTETSAAVRSALFEHAAAVVHPAVHGGFADLVLEALACGVPVVVSDAGPAPELVDGAGAVVAHGDEAQLAIEVHRVLDDADWRRWMVEAGLDRARAHTAPEVARQLLATYRSVTAAL